MALQHITILLLSILTFGLKIVQPESVENTTLDPSCSAGEFACANAAGLKCLPISLQCNGFPYICDDHSNILPSKCGNCSAENLFMCKMDGIAVCLHVDIDSLFVLTSRYLYTTGRHSLFSLVGRSLLSRFVPRSSCYLFVSCRQLV